MKKGLPAYLALIAIFNAADVGTTLWAVSKLGWVIESDLRIRWIVSNLGVAPAVVFLFAIWGLSGAAVWYLSEIAGWKLTRAVPILVVWRAVTNNLACVKIIHDFLAGLP